ncbi:hypothetical protein Btru_065860 [Bulinus truncatus]|nr:hypothetical protein Btru_065860 [Bulinus truncatus]
MRAIQTSRKTIIAVYGPNDLPAELDLDEIEAYMIHKMIRFLILAFCVTSLNSESSSYNFNEEYKMLLYEATGRFGDTKIAFGLVDITETFQPVNYTADVWLVNTTIFPGKDVLYLREQMSSTVVRKSLVTLYRADSIKIIINRYNFTAGVNPPDDPTDTTFFTDLSLNSLINMTKCNGTMYILQRRGTHFIGGIYLCEVDLHNPPKYTLNIWCDRVIFWSLNSQGTFIDFYTYPKSRSLNQYHLWRWGRL